MHGAPTGRVCFWREEPDFSKVSRFHSWDPRAFCMFSRESSPEHDSVSILGCDDATACHVVVLRHTENGATCLTHGEGTDTEAGVPLITNSITRSFFRRRSVRKGAGAPPGRLQ